MLNQESLGYGKQKSIIRELAGFGAERAKIVGKENVLDFSLGNPSVPAPDEVQEAIVDIINTMPPKAIHSYSAAPGHEGPREAIAQNLNKRYGTDYTANNIFMTCGAAPALMATLKTIVHEEGAEVIVVAPFFPEYTPFIESLGGKKVMVEARDDMQLHPEDVEAVITEKTQGIIINTPNNPGGVIYPKEALEELARILKKKSEEYGHPIYLISDEPYRELVLVDDAEVTWIPSVYDDTIVVYSWSKSLSLPGERIGYVLVPNTVSDEDFYAGVAGSARVLGHVCPPTLMQLVVERCVDVEPDKEAYKKNRDLLFDGLTEMGYQVAKPAGAFYLFVKAPDGDSMALSEKAKEHDMLIVPGGGFGAPEFVRLSYCVDTETCEKSLPIFEEIMKSY